MNATPTNSPAAPTDGRELRTADFPHRREMPIRWIDIDRYGHLNNAVHYLLMDTLINDWVASSTGSQPHELPAVGLVVETGCRYLREILPEHTPITLGLRVEGIGNSSVRYQVGFFIDDGEPAALARFVHVYADPETRRPVPVPDVVRSAAEAISA